MTEEPAGVVVGLLGPVSLTVDGQITQVSGLRQRAVLAVLAAGTGAVPTERLAEAVWSDSGRPASRSTLQVHVHQLRRLLGRHGGALHHTPTGYRLDGVEVDVRIAEDRLRQGRAAARAGDPVGAARSYRAGLALWRGEFCADLPDLEYFTAARALYETVRLDALEAAIGAGLRIGTPGLAVELDALLERYPLHERFWGQLMVALHRDGRQADALAAYRRARAVLVAETGLDPGAALQQLERAVLARAGTTALLRVVAPGVPGPDGRACLTWLDDSGVARRRELPPSGRVVIGRSAVADVALGWDAAVSREHAAIVVDATVSIEDLGSRNGTFHNGVRLPSTAGAPADLAVPLAQPLRPGDLVRCGDSVLAVSGPPGSRRSLPADDDTRTGIG